MRPGTSWLSSFKAVLKGLTVDCWLHSQHVSNKCFILEGWGAERHIREMTGPPKDDRLPPVHTVTRMDLLVALGGRGQEGGGQSRVHGEEGGLGTSKGTLIHSPPPTADRENNLYNG